MSEMTTQGYEAACIEAAKLLMQCAPRGCALAIIIITPEGPRLVGNIAHANGSIPDALHAVADIMAESGELRTHRLSEEVN